jgi:hypothetical protein
VCVCVCVGGGGGVITHRLDRLGGTGRHANLTADTKTRERAQTDRPDFVVLEVAGIGRAQTRVCVCVASCQTARNNPEGHARPGMLVCPISQ